MKKSKNKLIAILLIVLTLFSYMLNIPEKALYIEKKIYANINTTQASKRSFLTTIETTSPAENAQGDDKIQVAPSETEEIVKGGETSQSSSSKHRNHPVNDGSTLWVILTLVITFFVYPLLIAAVPLTFIGANNTTDKYVESFKKGLAEYDKKYGVDQKNTVISTILPYLMTIEKIFFGDIDILNVNIYKMSEKKEIGSNTGNDFKKGIAEWAGITRVIAVTLSFILMLIGAIMLMVKNARMSTNAKGIAASKEFLIDVAKGIGIALSINLIFALMLFAHDILLGILNSIRYVIVESGNKNVEITIYEILLSNPLTGGSRYAVSILTVAILIVYQIKFLVIYANRLITIGFIIVIAPIISVTYAIDKIGDGKSQVLRKMFKEFVDAIMIGIIYPIIYLVFMTGLAPIVVLSPLLGLIIIMLFSKIEEMFKKIFGIASTSIGNLTPGLGLS